MRLESSGELPEDGSKPKCYVETGELLTRPGCKQLIVVGFLFLSQFAYNSTLMMDVAVPLKGL
jgi:hypothetical protein